MRHLNSGKAGVSGRRRDAPPRTRRNDFKILFALPFFALALIAAKPPPAPALPLPRVAAPRDRRGPGQRAGRPSCRTADGGHPDAARPRPTRSSGSSSWSAALLRRADLPPRDPRLHGPGRRPQGHRRGRIRAARPQGRIHHHAVPPRDSRRRPLGFARTAPTANSSSCSSPTPLSRASTRCSAGCCRAWMRSTRSRPASRRRSPTRIVHATLGG